MQPQNSGVFDGGSWDGLFFRAAQVTGSDGGRKTVFRYEIPYPKETEAIRFYRYSIPEDRKKDYYSGLAQCVQRHVAVSNYLKCREVPSILTYESVSQEKDPQSGVTAVCLRTEQVWPITTKLLREQIDLTTLLDIFIRLTVIVRDMAKCGVSHRGIDLNEVYLSAENRILLSGFYYAVAPELSEVVPYMPEQKTYMDISLQEGAPGCAATDMRTLSRILYNLCAGVPWDARWTPGRMIAPEYAPEELIQTLLFGMNCSESECNAFRRRLLDCRKAINKTEDGKLLVPIRSPLLYELTYG